MTMTETLPPPAKPALFLSQLLSQAVSDQRQKEHDAIVKARADYYAILQRRNNARPGDGKLALKLLALLGLEPMDLEHDCRALTDYERIVGDEKAAAEAYAGTQKQVAELHAKAKRLDVAGITNYQRQELDHIRHQIREIEEQSDPLWRRARAAEDRRKEFVATSRTRRIFGSNW